MLTYHHKCSAALTWEQFHKGSWNKPVARIRKLHCQMTITSHRVFVDVIKWKHFPRYWPFLRGIHRSLVNSLHKGQWRRALMFSLICAWMNGWVNNGEAGDLRRHRAHYDVIVMCMNWMSFLWLGYPKWKSAIKNNLKKEWETSLCNNYRYITSHKIFTGLCFAFRFWLLYHLVFVCYISVWFFLFHRHWDNYMHCNDVIMGVMASQLTSLTIVYSAVGSDADQRKHQSSASLAFLRGIHPGDRWNPRTNGQ